MNELLEKYLRRLTDLTSRNRSLLLLKLLKQADLDLYKLKDGTGEDGFRIVAELVAKTRNIILCPVSDSRDHTGNELSGRLRHIARKDAFITAERGTRDLFLAWGFLQGSFIGGQIVRGPLLLFPVQISQMGNNWILNLREGEPLNFNKSLLLALAHYQGIEIPENLYEKDLFDFDADMQIFRTQLYKLLKESAIDINYNAETFVNRLIPFKDYLKSDFEKKAKEGELTLMPSSVLGFFPQAGSFLLPDYEHMMTSGNLTDMEKFFLERNSEAKDADHRPRHVKEEETLTPFKLDISQEIALKAVKLGKSMVVKGPPGTGKSQLICNLAADFSARGKCVLVVCEKRAALDVVHARLSSRGLGEFAALVHDFKDDRSKLYRQIDDQAERLDEYKNENGRLDTVVVEREHLHACREIDKITAQLEEFKEALFNTADCGLSPKELYLSSDLSMPQLSLTQEYQKIKPAQVSALQDKLRHLLNLAQQIERSAHPWAARRSFAKLGIANLPRILKTLDDLVEYKESINQQVRQLLSADLSFAECEWVLGQKEKLYELLHLLSSGRTMQYFRDALGHRTESLWLNNRERIIMQCFEGTPPEVELEIQEVGYVRAAIDSFLHSRTRPLAWLKWQFSEEKALLRNALSVNNLPQGKSGVKELRNRIDQRLNLEHNLTAIKTKTYLQDLPQKVDKVALRLWFHHQKEAFKAKLIYDGLRSLAQYLPFKTADHAELSIIVKRLIGIINEIPLQKEEWLKHLSPVQVTQLLASPSGVQPMQESLIKDFDALVAYDAAKEGLSPTEGAIAEKLKQLLSDFGVEESLDILDNSLKVAWIDHIEAKNPILKKVSQNELDKLSGQLQEKIRVKNRLSHQIVMMRLRERTYQGVAYNRLQNMVTYRELTHQVRKKRKLWPLRKLIAHFADEVFDLIPCWLASPETVSAIFDTTQRFDLVIFDEASQSFVEKALPSVYRAKQVVIVGDEHQLRPSDLYQVRPDAGDEEGLLLEVESLLELGMHYLPATHLLGHYRSEALSLIAFSNRHWYKGRLRMIPQRERLNNDEPAIQYVRIQDGVWENQANEAEARAVIKILRSFNQQSDGPSVGVVTFNFPQQQLILDLIDEDEELTRLKEGTEPLFVKNIENVQGDERDIIIMSLAYAPDAQGKLRYNFGSLSSAHGANRLNVAITRARQKMAVVTSLAPQDLKISTSRHGGPKLLKEYLQYCWEVSEGMFTPAVDKENKIPPDWHLGKRLAEKLRSQPATEAGNFLPFADVTVKRNGHYDSLILTDDDIFYTSLSVKDSMALLPMELEKKGWPVSRQWSREWWRATSSDDADIP